MRKVVITVSIFAVIVLLLIGFIEKPVSNNSTDKVSIEKNTIVDLKAESCKEFIEHLEKAGVKIKAIRKGSDMLLKGEATAININGEFINVYEYKNSDQMEADIKTIRSDGAIVGSAFVDWVSIPHIYKNGNIIVIYVGENNEIKDTIQKSLGNQFAGG